MGDPTLILCAMLVRSVNAAHAKHDARQAIAACVIQHVLIGCALRAAIRAVERQGAALVDSGSRNFVRWTVTTGSSSQRYVLKCAIHLVRGRKDESGGTAAVAQSLE